MAFVNEYIPETDYEKYDLRRICGEHNLAHKGHMHAQNWIVDREREMFLIKIWAHRESEADGWAFYRQGEWIFFEMIPKKAWAMPDASAGSFLFHVRNFTVPNQLKHKREMIVADLREAITKCPGSPKFVYAKLEVTVEFDEDNNLTYSTFSGHQRA